MMLRNYISSMVITGPSIFTISLDVLLDILCLFVNVCMCMDGCNVTDSAIFASRLSMVPFFLMMNMLDSVTVVDGSTHHQNNCLSKYLRNVPLTRYRAIGLMHEWMKLRQNPTIRSTCQNVLYSSVDLG